MSNGGYSTHDFLRAAAWQREGLQRQLGAAQHYLTVHHQRRGELERAYGQATADLGTTLLPELSQAALDRAVALTGFAALASENPLGQLEAERGSLSARIARIEADTRFTQRELLRHPTTGSLTRALRETEEMVGPFAFVVQGCRHPRLEQLLASGYGTPAYTTGFWRMSYYEDWKAGDEILERFPDKHLFAQVRDEYLRAIHALGPLQAEATRIRAELAAGETLEREHAQCAQGLANLVPRWLDYVRSRLTSFVLECPATTLAARLAHAPEVELAYKRALGLLAKTTYLDQLVMRDVESFRRDATQTLAKLDRNIAKYQRPKNAGVRFPAAEFERRFRDRDAAYQKRWRRFEKTYSTVYGYDRYHEVSLAERFLWWDLMTDGRIDGDFIPDVQRYRQQNPDYRYQPRRSDQGDEDLEALAAASSVAEDGALGLDVS